MPEEPKRKPFTLEDAKKALGHDYTEKDYRAKLRAAKKTPVKDVLRKLGYDPRE